MSSGEVNGRTKEELEAVAKDFYQNSKYNDRGFSFEEVYCLAEIRRQPEDYEGPQRYCVRYCSQKAKEPTEKEDIGPRCKFHGGNNVKLEGAEENLTPHETKKNLKHGMYASDDFLKEHFSENDQKLYDFIMSWAEAYGIDREENPGDYDILQQLAVERVRSERSADYLLDESETQESPVFDGQGNLIEREDVSNTLTEVHQRQRKLILKMMKELGITPKARSRMDKEEADTNASEALANIASDALSSDKGEYDPEQYEEE